LHSHRGERFFFNIPWDFVDGKSLSTVPRPTGSPRPTDGGLDPCMPPAGTSDQPLPRSALPPDGFQSGGTLAYAEVPRPTGGPRPTAQSRIKKTFFSTN